MENEFDQYYEAAEPGKRERAYGWATSIGLQDVDGLKPSPFLIETARENIESRITAAQARERIDEYYERKHLHHQDVVVKPDADVVVNDVVKTTSPLTPIEENAIKALLRDPRLSAARLAAPSENDAAPCPAHHRRPENKGQTQAPRCGQDRQLVFRITESSNDKRDDSSAFDCLSEMFTAA